jgi:hypothetical protein
MEQESGEHSHWILRFVAKACASLVERIDEKEILLMKRMMYSAALVLACGVLLIWGGKLMAAEEPAKVAGAWEMTSEGPRGAMTQTLKIQQDGSTIKGTLTGRRGESPLEGSVTGNKISFTVKRETPNGTFTIEYSGTVAGDTMKGKSHSERFDGEWTAKRASAPSEK